MDGDGGLGIAWPASNRKPTGHEHTQHQEPPLASAAEAAIPFVPFTAFSEYQDISPKGTKQIRWLAPPDHGMLFFAGICGESYGDYGSKKEQTRAHTTSSRS